MKKKKLLYVFAVLLAFALTLNGAWAGWTYTTVDYFTDGDYTNDPTWTQLSGTWSAASNYLSTSSADSRMVVGKSAAHDANLDAGVYAWRFSLYPASVGAPAIAFILTNDNGDNANHNFVVYATAAGECDAYFNSYGTAAWSGACGITGDAWNQMEVRRTPAPDCNWSLYVGGVFKKSVQNCGYAATNNYYKVIHGGNVGDGRFDTFDVGVYSATAPPSNPLALAITKPADGNYWSGTKNIFFSITDTNGAITPGLKLYYSKTAGARTNLIVNDTNLLDGNAVICPSYDFSTGQSCYYSFNTSVVIDGNYFIDGNLYNADWNKTASSASFNIDNTAPTTSATATQRANRTDANISFSCSDTNSGCVVLAYKVDSNVWTFISGSAYSFIYFEAGDHNLYYYSSDRADNNEATKTLAFTITPDTTSPTITFSTSATYGFTSSFNVNFSLKCVDDRNDLMRYDVNRNDTNNIYTANDYNGATKTGAIAITSGWTTFTGACTDASGNQTTADSNTFYAVLFKLINESTGAVLSYGDVNQMVSQALAYTYDGNYSYDFNATSTSQAYFFSPSTVVRFDFTYKDADETRVSREVDFAYLDANASIGICLAPFQQFYEQIFVSSQIKPVIVYNDFAKCYNLASSTKFAYENALSTKALTIAKPYYVYTYSNGVKSLLALIEGTIASVINIDVLEFNQNTYDIALAYDTVVFQPLFNSSTGLYDTNTIQIFYKSLKGTNTAASFNIYNGSTLLWSYSEPTSFNEFLVSFYYSDMNISDANLLKLELTITNPEGITTTDYYFNILGASYQGLLNPFLAMLLAFGLLFVGLTLVAYRYAMGWFGLILGASAIGILALAPGYWYIRFAQAIILIIIVFIVLIYKSETVGIN